MKSVGVDDAVRGDMTVLPRRTLSETYNHVARIPISGGKPWVLQEFVRGREYCTHSLVVRGEVKAFLACQSKELLMHYEALPEDSTLGRAMLRFTRELVGRMGGGGRTPTGHLSFDFLVRERVTERGVDSGLVVIECNPRAHTAVALFAGRESALTEAYLSVLDDGGKASNLVLEGRNGHVTGPSPLSQPEDEVDGNERADIVMPTSNPPRIYWIGHDLLTLLILPFFDLITRSITFSDFFIGIKTFTEHILWWQDGTFELWDPLPAWWLYHVYWPAQFLGCILSGKRWSRINVSTAKVFES